MTIKRITGFALKTGLVVFLLWAAQLAHTHRTPKPGERKLQTAAPATSSANESETQRRRTRPPLVMCKRTIDPPAPSPFGLGLGITAVPAEDLKRRPPETFHATFRSGNYTVDVYGDGTVDYLQPESAQSFTRVRYRVPKADVTQLSIRLRQLDPWRTAKRLEIMDAYLPEYDLTMDGRTQKRMQIDAGRLDFSPGAIGMAIASTTRIDAVGGDLDLRLRLLAANGFRFDSTEGADLALALVLNGRRGARALEALPHYNFPCAGGLYETLMFPPMHDIGAWSLQEALRKRGLGDLLKRFGPAPVVPPDPSTEPSYPQDRPQEGFAWTIFPTEAQIQAAYPARAREDEVEGAATVICDATRDGRLKCRVLSEKPPGYGFGPATVRLFEAQGRVRVERPGAPPRNGLVTLHWTLS